MMPTLKRPQMMSTLKRPQMMSTLRRPQMMPTLRQQKTTKFSVKLLCNDLHLYNIYILRYTNKLELNRIAFSNVGA